MPSQSVDACVFSFEPRGLLSRALTALSSGEPAPNAVVTSLGTDSNSMLPTENAPTSQPARVNGTHGAGAILPSSFAICGLPSADFAVQYRNELWKPTDPSGRKKP